MYKLAERPGDSAGVYCGAGGLFLGRSPLIARIGATYRIRVDDEIAGLLAAAYGSIEEAERLRPRLRLIRSALQDGDHCRAMILAVQARLGPVAAEGIARLAQTESLCKYTSIPTSRRDPHGRWTSTEDGASPGGTSVAAHPAPPSSEHPTYWGNENPTQIAQNAPLDFSTHAWARMQQRGITPDRVMDAVKNGTRVTQPNGNIRCTGAGCVVVINPSGRIVTIY